MSRRGINHVAPPPTNLGRGEARRRSPAAHPIDDILLLFSYGEVEEGRKWSSASKRTQSTGFRPFLKRKAVGK